MTRKEICKSMTLQDAIQVFRDTNAYGTMDLAKTVILEALEQHQHYKDLAESYEKTINKLTEAIAEQQPSNDCISRKEAIDALKQQADNMYCWSGRYNEQRKGILIAINIVSDCSSVTPQPKTESEGKQ